VFQLCERALRRRCIGSSVSVVKVRERPCMTLVAGSRSVRPRTPYKSNCENQTAKSNSARPNHQASMRGTSTVVDDQKPDAHTKSGFRITLDVVLSNDSIIASPSLIALCCAASRGPQCRYSGASQACLPMLSQCFANTGTGQKSG